MKIRFTIGKRIVLGYALILGIMLISGIVSITALRESRVIDQENAGIYQPSADRIKEFRSLSGNIEALSKNWIYQPSEGDKNRLKDLLSNEMPLIRKELDGLAMSWQDQTLVKRYNDSKILVDEMAKAADDISKWLSTPEAYDDGELVDRAITAHEKVLLPNVEKADVEIASLFDAISKSSEQLTLAKYSAFDRTEWMTIASTLISLTIGSLFAWLTTRRITRPVAALRQSIEMLGTGRLPSVKLKKTDDEIGTMVGATEILIDGLRKTSAFASEIGKGNLDSSFTALSDSDVLGNSLLAMRNSLKHNADEDRKRNWAVTGLAEFGEILRGQDQNLEKFADEVLRFIVKYTHSNQGRLYVLDDEDKANEHLRMVACYAYDKKKYLDQIIRPGEGLTGQCWQEGECVYMTSVPEDFIKITSGLGSANPRNIFIAPLKVNGLVYGVLELASFNLYHAYERELIVKLSENLAAALSTVNLNEKTRTLLEQTRQQAEEMRSQEEEMRQNLEELSATQEEMLRKEKEYLKKIAELEAVIGSDAGKPKRHVNVM